MTGESIKDLVDTKPNFSVVLDKDMDISQFANIDDPAACMDRGGEDY